MTDSSANTNYTAHCHCRAVNLTITNVAPISSIVSCNCSICVDRGSLIVFFPVGSVKLPENEDNITTYMWNKKILAWKFCKHCGSTVYATSTLEKFKERVGVNARCIEGLDLESIETVKHDGKTL